MIAILEQQVRENYEQQLNKSIVNKGKKYLHFDFRQFWLICLDELWNLYLDFCIQRLSQAPDSTKNEVNNSKRDRKYSYTDVRQFC